MDTVQDRPVYCLVSKGAFIDERGCLFADAHQCVAGMLTPVSELAAPAGERFCVTSRRPIHAGRCPNQGHECAPAVLIAAGEGR